MERRRGKVWPNDSVNDVAFYSLSGFIFLLLGSAYVSVCSIFFLVVSLLFVCGLMH